MKKKNYFKKGSAKKLFSEQCGNEQALEFTKNNILNQS